jgi:hypothetical protein
MWGNMDSAITSVIDIDIEKLSDTRKEVVDALARRTSDSAKSKHWSGVRARAGIS